MEAGPEQIARATGAAGRSALLLVDDNVEAFAVRRLAAREARERLDLIYYMWRDDQCGRALLEDVIDAARRGVKVRMLLDDINPHANDATYLRLDDTPNIEVKLFNPSRARDRLFWRRVEMVMRMRQLNRRMHCKAWIADGRVAIIGGRNIGDEYFDAADTNFRDMDLLAEGAAAEQACAVFERYWASEAAVPIGALHPMRKRRIGFPKRKPANRDATARKADARAASLAEFVASKGGLRDVAGARVIADPPEKIFDRKKTNWLMAELLPVIESAASSVDIVSPYFIPGREGVEALAGLVRRGVATAVLTNSLAATDIAAVHGAYANYRRALLKSGVRLYELRPYGDRQRMSVFGSKGASLHTKAFVVDRRIGFVGSFNFDPRSLSLNTEMGILFEDEAMAGELSERLWKEKSRRSSYRLFLDGWLMRWEAYSDGKLTLFGREPEARIGRRILAAIVRRLPLERLL